MADEDNEFATAVELSLGENSVKAMPNNSNTHYWYKYTPDSDGTYVFSSFYGVVYSRQGASNWFYKGSELTANQTYYFYFETSKENETQEKVSLLKKSDLDINKTKIVAPEKTCKLAVGDRYATTGVSYQLYYVDGTNTETKILRDSDEKLVGRYQDMYELRLKNEKGNVFSCWDSLAKGTYTLCLWTYANETDSSEFTEVMDIPDYTVEVKNITDLPTRDLPTGLSQKVSLSDTEHNNYVYYKFDATVAENKGEYYFNVHDLEEYFVKAFYYNDENKREDVEILNTTFKLENHIYYFIFEMDSMNDLTEATIDFNREKKITALDISETADKLTYLAKLEYPLNDVQLKLTYGENDIEYVNVAELKHTGMTYVDSYNNVISCSVKTSAGENSDYIAVEWWKPGNYEITFWAEGTDKVTKNIEITMPTENDWAKQNKVLHIGSNLVNCAMAPLGIETYFMFKPVVDGKYTITDSNTSDLIDDQIYVYDEATNTFERIETEEAGITEGTKIFDAKASVEYYYASDSYNGAERTLKITSDHEHSYVSKITKEATCTEAGILTYTCTECGDSYTKTIPATGHKLTTIPAKVATCTATGLTEGKKCTVCGTVTVPQQTVPATGHNSNVNIPGTAATCTSNGLTDGKKCSVCGTVIVAQQVIPAYGHAMGGWVITQQPTALADGVQTRTCSRCGYAETAGIARLAATGTLNATYLPLKIKKSVTLKVNGLAAGDYVTSWKTSNAKIATVDARSGRVTGKKTGTAYITATMASGLTLKATIKVQKGAVQASSIWVNTRSVTLSQNQATQLLTSITPITAPQKASYSSSNKKVATVSGNGRIVGKKAGKATITVRVGKKSVRVYVTVVGVKTTAISVNTTQINLKVKKSATIKTSLTPKNSSEAVAYKSSNSKVATVNNKGKVYGKKAGTAVITVKSGSKSVKVNVTVKK